MSSKNILVSTVSLQLKAIKSGIKKLVLMNRLRNHDLLNYFCSSTKKVANKLENPPNQPIHSFYFQDLTKNRWVLNRTISKSYTMA